VGISCLFGDFNVYASPLSNNIRLWHRIAPATNRQYFILALSLPLRWLRITQFVLNTLIALKSSYFSGQ
jgi:hypothetical protein